MIISISGTPGTGKTEVARALSDRLGWRLIKLNGLAKEKDLYTGYDETRKCKIVDVDGVKKEVECLGKSNKNMILESHYAQDMPCDVAVILRANPGELRGRLVGKGWTKRKIDENMEVCKTDAIEQGRKILEIDTTGKTASSVAEEIRKQLKF